MSRLMNIPWIAGTAGTLALALTVSLAASATEIQLKAEAHCRRSLATLGDVADVCDTDPIRAARLARIELFPTPPAGRVRTLRVRELQDLLSLRSVNLRLLRFSGASVVAIRAADGAGPGAVAKAAGEDQVSAALVDIAKRRVENAVVRYLQQHVDPAAAWSVTADLADDQVRLVSAARGQLAVSGGRTPWTGRQDFTITIGATADAAPLVVAAHVTLPAMVVATTRSLRRGEIIGAEDVRLRPGPDPSRSQDLLRRIDEVVGKETTRSIATDQPIDRRYVRPPILVRRGEMVTVYARTAGLYVRTTARALEDGSLGELVTVESLLNRKRYSARVAKIQQVEVYAGGTSVEDPAMSQSGLDQTER